MQPTSNASTLLSSGFARSPDQVCEEKDKKKEETP